jgi:hypothetical protein
MSDSKKQAFEVNYDGDFFIVVAEYQFLGDVLGYQVFVESVGKTYKVDEHFPPALLSELFIDHLEGIIAMKLEDAHD